MSGLDVICFDADDTLWHNLVHFDASEKSFGAMMSGFVSASDARRALEEAEKRNIALYGFGVKSFTLSMIETAINISGGRADAAMIGKLIGLGREMLDHSIEFLPHVEDTLKALHGSHRLLLVTKGDLHHQERKVLASGLADFFEDIEIVSDKQPATFARICRRHGAKPERTLMVGNSIRSDVLPMIAAGGYGVYVPFDIIWEHDHDAVPPGLARYFEIANLAELPGLVAQLQLTAGLADQSETFNGNVRLR